MYLLPPLVSNLIIPYVSNLIRAKISNLIPLPVSNLIIPLRYPTEYPLWYQHDTPPLRLAPSKYPPFSADHARVSEVYRDRHHKHVTAASASAASIGQVWFFTL